MGSVDFNSYELVAPTYDGIAAEYAAVASDLEAATSGHEAIVAVEKWDAIRRRLSTWDLLVHIRFHQDTQNELFKKAREYRDELTPKLTNLAVDMKRRLVESPHRAALAQRFGTHAFDLWRCDIASFDPVIESDLVRQSELDANYVELLASAKFDFQGETLTLSQMAKFDEHPERSVRHDAASLRWKWFGGNREKLDEIFDGLVKLRHGMAKKLGHKDFIESGYQWMHRIDYGQDDVERFRDQVRECVVPLVTKLRSQQAKRLGVDPLMAWDEGIQDPTGNPQPQGEHDWMIDRAAEMFQQLGEGMAEFFAEMRAGHLMDLNSREAKAGGGFCGLLSELGMPFIYANFNGTMQDVRVFTHEMGHAFQCYSSRNQPLDDYLWPTMEACEIHSMGLEFLSWPQMEFFFGDDAPRFRRMHLTQLLTFLPYGVAVDHFQHLVYANPSSSADDRARMWQEMEQIYLPSLRWGDLDHPASGRRWQAQLHIFGSPFYYIDYTLALTCALQLWVRAEKDRAGTLDAYANLCRRGGEAPFGELVRSAGLTSPFESGCLESVVARAARELNCTL